MYLNVHDDEFPAGEIRGQILPAATPEPASWGLLALGGVADGGRRAKDAQSTRGLGFSSPSNCTIRPRVSCVTAATLKFGWVAMISRSLTPLVLFLVQLRSDFFHHAQHDFCVRFFPRKPAQHPAELLFRGAPGARANISAALKCLQPNLRDAFDGLHFGKVFPIRGAGTFIFYF